MTPPGGLASTAKPLLWVLLCTSCALLLALRRGGDPGAWTKQQRPPISNVFQVSTSDFALDTSISNCEGHGKQAGNFAADMLALLASLIGLHSALAEVTGRLVC